MPGACAGLRVLDLTQGLAGPMATMILADFGAEVVRVEPAKGDPGWATPGYLLLQRGKKSIDLDVASAGGQAEIRRLAAGFDVVVESLGPGVADEAGIGYEALSAVNPQLVFASVTGWGRTGPFSHLKADDALAMAKAGIMRFQPGWYGGDRPVFRASPDPSYFAGMLLVQGVLAALRVRDRTGEGQLVETNLLAALTCRQNPAVRWLLREHEELPSESGPGQTEVQSEQHVLPHHMDPRQINLIGMRVETKDGKWLVHSHTEKHFFPAWVKTIGFDWIWDDERYKGAPWDVSAEAKEELIRKVQARMKEKTAAEWMELYVANGNVCGDTIQTTQDALRHPQTLAAGLVVEIEDPRVGPTVQVGPLCSIPGAPAAADRPAPIPGADTEALLTGEVAALAPVTADATLRRPLEGITIVECAYYYATPFATALLAELGARVIKIEPLRKDPYRIISSAGVGDPVLNLGHNNMVRAFQGKEDIALNLKDPAGQEVMRRLIVEADVFVHSFRGEVPKSLGVDEETLRAVNPNLLYHYGASYGSTGPYTGQPAIDPIIAAYAGTTAHQAGEGNAPLTETGADPVAATGHATAMMLGLFARERTGVGQHLESWMIVSNIYLNAEDAISYEGKPPRREVDSRQLGLGPAYRLYETAPVPAGTKINPHFNQDPRWVFLAVEDDDEFTSFCSVAGRDDLANDERFASRAARDEHRDELAAELEALFLGRTAIEWEQLMVPAGVGCVMADAASHFAFLYEDEQAKAIDIMSETEHSAFGGKYWRYAPLLRFSKTPGVGGPFCEFGEHTRAILAELGYSDSEMEKLKESGVVTWPVEQSEEAAALS
jgi:crotonobetainyl-CoA:carnitine CoA-transferase CaiB-like acyl-CoA transferase